MKVRLPMLRSAVAAWWSESACAESAVNRDRDAGYDPRLVRREECCQRTDLFGLAVAAERMHVTGAFPDQRRRACGNGVAILCDRRFDHARANRNASNIVAREVERDPLRHDHDAALRGLVSAKIRHAL